MNEGPVATLLGLRGTSTVGETIMVERDVMLAELTGGKVPHRPRLGGGLGGRGAPRQGPGRAGHRRGHAAPPAADRPGA